MILLQSGVNEVNLTLKEKTTLADPIYVLVFVNDHTFQKFACKVTDTSLEPDTINKFQVTVKENPNWLNGEVNLRNYGFYHYYAFEADSISGYTEEIITAEDIRYLVPDLFVTELEVGKMNFKNTPAADNFYKDVREAVKTYGE